MTTLTVIYDDTCEFCRRCRRWLEGQRLHVRLQYLAASDPAATARYGPADKLRQDLVVVADDGRAWVGPSAFVTLLWTTRRYRGVARRLANPALLPIARRTFHVISSNRGSINTMLQKPSCEDGACEVPT